MQRVVEMCAAMVLTAAVAACSHGGGAGAVVTSPAKSEPAASAAPQSAVSLQAPASGRPSASPVHGPSLSVMLQRGSLARAFAALDGAAALPAWVKTAHADTPSTRVRVDGKTEWLATACAPAGCRAGELLVLADLPAHALHGVYAERSGSAGASVGKLVWLGKPDAATTTFLEAHLPQH